MSLTDEAGQSGAGASLRLDDFLPYRLSVAANAVSDVIASSYQNTFRLSIPQWRLMAVLGEDGPMTPQALCARTVMDKVTVSRAAAALHERKLVEREPNASDGRSHRVGLTQAGQDLYAQIAPLALAHEARLLEGFTPFERATMQNLLRRLQEAAEKARLEGYLPYSS
jgi:DNA-binding MarR family transcriptional regulator